MRAFIFSQAIKISSRRSNFDTLKNSDNISQYSRCLVYGHLGIVKNPETALAS